MPLSHSSASMPAPAIGPSQKNTRRPALMLLLGMAAALSAHAQLNFVTPAKLADTLTGTGSPTLVTRAGSLDLYYIKNGSQPNKIYVDFGVSGSPIATNLTAYPAQINDVGAATLSNGNILVSYISSTTNAVAFAYSGDGINFSTVSVSSSSLGLPSGQVPNYYFVPALVNNNGTVYIATVATDNNGNNLIYMSSTVNGITFTPLSPGQPVNGNSTVSRPSLTVYSGTTWLGFTSSSAREAIVGNILAPSTFNAVSSYSWGNSNRNNFFAGISLVGYGNVLYVFGQSTNSNHDLLYTYSSHPASPTSWSPQTTTNPLIQMRWTPSVLLYNNVYLTYQGDSDNNVHFTHN